jgi:hypothetical protein
MNWDPFCNRFVFVSKDVNGFPNAQVWYGHSTDSTGTSWVFGNNQQPIFSSGAGNWDYPSIGVDASGRIIAGAVPITSSGCPPDVSRCPDGYYTVVASGSSCLSEPTFTPSPTPVGNPPVNSVNTGAYSRVVATDNRFEAFVPTLDPTVRTPMYIARYESVDGINWSADVTIGMGTFGPAFNNAPDGSLYNIYYAPLPTAQGYKNGLWAVAFQLDNGGYNNAAICTSDRGCGYINNPTNDQFLVGTSVSGDSGYWLNYYTYNATPRHSPRKTVAIYFPYLQSGISADTNPAVDPTSWSNTQSKDRCNSACYAAGDFQTIASNPAAGAATPFVNSGVTGAPNDIFSTFVYDPQGAPNVPNYRPNFVPIPRGASAAGLARPVPPESYGLPPARQTGLPKIK